MHALCSDLTSVFGDDALDGASHHSRFITLLFRSQTAEALRYESVDHCNADFIKSSYTFFVAADVPVGPCVM